MATAVENLAPNAYLPDAAEIIERIQEAPNIFTLRMRFIDPEVHRRYSFVPGQFNMVYLYGVGEIPVSIVSDPEDAHQFDHTIRVVGRVTKALDRLRAGDKVGIRGPYGRGWPIGEALGKDVLLVTGGLGCAPLVSMIHYILRRRSSFGQFTIMQGVKKSADLIWRKQYEQWALLPNTRVLLAADVGDRNWRWTHGPVIRLFEQVEIDAPNTIALLCGPEPMMGAGVKVLCARQVPAARIWLSMERNMQCAVGHCGHCQYGGLFLCKNGPVFPYTELAEFFGKAGF